uniref:Leucine-rich repeat-containing protein 7 n=1 Tax=Hymenolepis diminuta TaxID=6216 RepID=A0A0R3SH07_HYMDI
LVELDLGSNHLSSLPEELEALVSLEMFRLSYNQLRRLPNTLGKLQRLRVLDLESNQLESLPPCIGDLVNLQDLNVSCNRLTTFPPSIGNLRELRIFKAGENDITELPPEIGNMANLHDFYLNDNHNLNNIPAEMSQCPVLTILSVENCPLRDLPQPIVSGGSAMIIYPLPPFYFALPPDQATLLVSPGIIHFYTINVAH